jgi:glutaryl-CoA dehydrogenase
MLRTDTLPEFKPTIPVHDYGVLPRVDFYDINSLLSPAEQEIRDRVRGFVDREITPVIADYIERAEFPFHLIDKLKTLNLAGGPLMGYGCPGISFKATGVATAEMARGDGSIATFYGVHSGLAMGAIWLFGSYEQKKKWLPAMAKLEKIGAFALTEPNHGSDSIALESSARQDGDDWILNGSKRWIGNGTIADVIVFNARDSEGKVREFLIEKDMPGFKAVTDVRVPKENLLPGVRSFKDVGKLLAVTRFGVAWECVGHAMAAYECALAYALERKQFGKPLAQTQLVQAKLATMLADITAMQMMMMRLSDLAQQFKMTNGQCSMAKMFNAKTARRVVSEARDILGGNGILYEYIVARHFLDMEVVYTYEGTDSIQTLIVGKEITGMQAFA